MKNFTNFEEFSYFKADFPTYSYKINPDVEEAIKAGGFVSGLEHYLQYGQFEGRVGIFSGTRGNDIVTGFGESTVIYGVERSVRPCVQEFGSGQCMDTASFGSNEVDVLIGGSGKDRFVLGQLVNNSTKLPNAISFYTYSQDADFATIKNFEVGKDTIILGAAMYKYNFIESNEGLNIFFLPSPRDSNPQPAPDLVATVEGVTSLSQIESSLQFTGGLIF